jgi:hypothetical protein
VYRPFLDVQVTDNEVDNTVTGLALFGGQGGARPTFAGNDVDGNSAAGSRGFYMTTSVLTLGSTNVEVDFGPNNNVADNDTNLFVEQQPGFTSDADITDNTGISGAGVSGLATSGTGIANDILISNTPFTNNAVHAAVNGAFVQSTENSYTGGTSGFVVGLNGGTFLCENIFSGLSSWNVDLLAAADPGAQYVHGNQFDGTGPGVRNQAAAQLDAEGNFWGVATGPNTGGNTTSGNIDFTPFQFSADAPAYVCWTGFIAPCDLDGFFQFPTLVLADTCDASTVVIEYSIGGNPIGGDQASYNYPYGTTQVTLTVTDDDGSSSCTFDVDRFFNVQPPIRPISDAQADGHITQSAEIPTSGFQFMSKDTVLFVGDNTSNLAFRGVVDFDTTLPANSVILSARIRMTQSSSFGSNTGFGGLVLDMGSPNIGATSAMTGTDWDDSAAAFIDVASSFPYPGGNGHSTYAEIDPAYFDDINVNGRTQFRIRFNTLTDSDNASDYIAFASGSNPSSTNRPEMIVEYYIDNECYEFQPQTTNGAPVVLELFSLPADDGGTTESHETSGIGGSSNSTAGSFQVGDTAQRQQMKALLSFDTSAIPVNATIQSATIRMYRTSGVGNVSTLGNLVMDTRIPAEAIYGSLDLVENADFQVFSHIPNVATFAVIPPNNNYLEVPLTSAGLLALNKGSKVQYMLHFEQDDNNNLLSDQVTFASGNFGIGQPARPRLLVTYLAP